MLTVHHLQRGQSERIVWLCEELGVDYRLVKHQRDPQTRLSPASLKAIHPTGAAPVIQDGEVTLAESAAIVEYILAKYGQGKLSVSPEADNYADYLYYLHFTNGTLQPATLFAFLLSKSGVDPQGLAMQSVKARHNRALGILEERLSRNQWLAGDSFTAADVMVVFSLTTMRVFYPYSLTEYPTILEYLGRTSMREAYQRAMAKGDPGFEPLIAAEVS